MRPLAGLIGLWAGLAASPSLLCAQTASEFYKGKTVDVYVGTSVGGGYDAYARLLSRHMGRHVPGNPIFVPKNMEGSGGIRLANFLYNVAPKDGSTFGTFNRGTGFDPLFGNKGAQFDATRLNWIGSANNEVSVCVAWHTTGVSRYEELFSKELVVGASGPAADTYQFPKIVNGVLGTRFKIIAGYPGGNDIDLAMERGEVQGRCGWSWTSVKATHQPRPKQDPHPVPDRAIQASRLAERTAHHGFGQDRRGAGDLQGHFRAAGDGLAVHCAARRAEGAHQRTPRCLHGYDEGQGIPGRSRQSWLRD